MTVESAAIELRTSPHVKKPVSTDEIMLNVVIALLPVCAFSVWAFGWSALALIITTTTACVLTEHIICVVSGRATTVTDFSVAVTGILLGLTLPPGFPLWMAAVGAIIAVVLGKALFGGLGYNKFNPALVGRAFLQAAFPVAITSWTPAFAANRFAQFIPTTLTLPFLTPDTKKEALATFLAASKVDGWTGATPLSLIKFQDIATSTADLAYGMTAGSAGETCAWLILLCGAYLVARNMMNWRIPASMLLTAFAVSGLFWLSDQSNPTPWFMVFSGGLVLGAVFMASDMVASPTSNAGAWIYGGVIGLITVIIRLKGGLPEGVMYAILLGNALSPHIERMTQRRVFGTAKKAKS